MLRKHFAMSGDIKPDFIITYHAPQQVPFFGGYAKNWVYGYPKNTIGELIYENSIKFKVIDDKWDNGVGEWKFKLADSSNKIYNSWMSGAKIDNSDDASSAIIKILSAGFGFADMYTKGVFDENNNIIEEKTVTVDNTNIITSVIFGEGINTINGSILDTTVRQSSCTEITLPESVTLLTGHLFDDYISLKTITVPLNVIRIDNLCDINRGNPLLEEIILKPLTPPDASNATKQTPLGSYSSDVKDSLKIRVYSDCIDTYKNDSIWSQYGDLYDTINDTIVFYTDEGRKLYTKNLDITSVNSGILPQSITNVYLPNSVTSIENNAFYGCTGLTSIEIPNSVTGIIGNSAFDGCSSLTSVVWNAINCSDFKYSYNPFYNIRKQITSFEFGDSVEHIPAYMCHGMSNINSIEIPDSVVSVGQGAFDSCSSLKSISIGKSVSTIGDMAFYNINSTETISVFISDLTAWCNITFEGSVSNPLASTYNNNAGLEGNLYLNNELLTHLEIPTSINSIKHSAFRGCSSIKSITIPNSVTSIEQYALSNCKNLKTITYNGSIAQWNSVIKKDDWNYFTPVTVVNCIDGDITIK